MHAPAEELLAAVAAAVGERICLQPERFAAVDMLGLPRQLFTSDPCGARISACPRHQVRAARRAPLSSLWEQGQMQQ